MVIYVHNFLVNPLSHSFSRPEKIETCDMNHNSQTFQPLSMVFLQAAGQYGIPLLLALKRNSWMDFSYDCEVFF